MYIKDSLHPPMNYKAFLRKKKLALPSSEYKTFTLSKFTEAWQCLNIP